jgi:hypothetical protein
MRPTASLVLTFVVSAVAGIASSAGASPVCNVSVVEVSDATRSRAEPYNSPSEPGSPPARIRGLVYAPGSSGLSAPTYAELVLAEGGAGSALAITTSALAYFGLMPEAPAIEAALGRTSSCRLAGLRPTAPRAAVIVLSAMPAIFYEELAVRLAAAGVATVIARASESEARLLLQQLVATERWPAERLAVVGHGAASYPAALLAMGSAGVRGRVALDGFEALDRTHHPGPTAAREWRPGHERAPVLLLRPRDRPHANLDHFERAARVALTSIEIPGLEASAWAPAPALAPAPAALRDLIPGLAPETAEALVAATAGFLAGALADRPSAEALVPPAIAGAAGALEVQHRPALPAPAIHANGRLDDAIWAGARTLDTDGHLTVRVADDCDWLYVAFEAERSRPFTSELSLDADGAGGERRGEDDLLLHASASLCWAKGDRDLVAADCNASEAWWVANRTVRAEDPKVSEYAIAKARLGLARCAPIDRIRFAARAGGYGELQFYPAAADPAKPSTWSAMPDGAGRVR